MIRVRKLALAIAAASSLSAGMAHALGLGEVTLHSALDQPLNAEIELLEVRDLGSAEVLSKLASPEEFTKAGIDRPYGLADLKFTPVIKAGGKSVIRVTSSKPVREPYLNFLVEVAWPTGRSLREYTLLLDPPLYTPQPVAMAPRLPAVAPVVRPSQPARVQAPLSPSAPNAAAVKSTSRISGDQYRTTAKDTLWEIAARVRPNNSVSVHQTMLAIQALNPDAFVGGNINRLKNNQVLRLPNVEQIKERNKADAQTQVVEQNNAWRQGRTLASVPPAAARQLDATHRAGAAETPAKVAEKDSLKLVSGKPGKASAGNDQGDAKAKALSEQLAVTKESLDSTRSENTELKSRMGDLQGQLDKLQKLMALKDAQLAKLQADLAAQEKAKQEAAQKAQEAQPAAFAAPAQPVAAPAPAAAAPASSEPVNAEPAKPEVDLNYAPETKVEEPAAVPKPQEASPAPTPVAAPAPEPVAQQPAPAPVVESEPAAEPSFIDDLMEDPLLLGAAGGGAVLLLLLVLMAISRRNAQKEGQAMLDLNEPQAKDLGLDELPQSSFDDLQGDDTLASSQEAPVQQTADALAEAEIYIAYGKFAQAEKLLQDALLKEPQRADLRLKLLEVLAEQGNRAGFDQQADEVLALGGHQAEVAALRDKYPAMAAVTVAAVDDQLANFSLDDLSLDEPAASPAPAAPVHSLAGTDMDDAFDLSLDDLEAQLTSDFPAANAAVSAPEDEFSFEPSKQEAASAFDELSSDFDLGLSEPAATHTDVSLGAELGDFSLDKRQANDEFLLDLETPAKADQPEEIPALDDLADFSLNEEPAAPVASALPDDFDLSLDDLSPTSEAPKVDDFAAQLEQVSAELEQMVETIDEPAPVTAPAPVAEAASSLEGDDDFDFLSGADEVATKLDLARAYIDMGDHEGARDILDEVLGEGSDAQKTEARELMGKLS